MHHVLHVMSHRKDVGLSRSWKEPGQRPFLGSLSRLQEPRASNERHDARHIPPLRNGTGSYGQVPEQGPLARQARLWAIGLTGWRTR